MANETLSDIKDEKFWDDFNLPIYQAFESQKKQQQVWLDNLYRSLLDSVKSDLENLQKEYLKVQNDQAELMLRNLINQERPLTEKIIGYAALVTAGAIGLAGAAINAEVIKTAAGVKCFNGQPIIDADQVNLMTVPELASTIPTPAPTPNIQLVGLTPFPWPDETLAQTETNIEIIEQKRDQKQLAFGNLLNQKIAITKKGQVVWNSIIIPQIFLQGEGRKGWKLGNVTAEDFDKDVIVKIARENYKKGLIKINVDQVKIGDEFLIGDLLISQKQHDLIRSICLAQDVSTALNLWALR